MMASVTEENGKQVYLNGKEESVQDEKSTDVKAKKKHDTEKNDTQYEERQEWSRGIEFLMSCIAMSVGLGNIWRFPFVAYQNGGGAFLIPYLIVLLVIGRPIYYLEMSLGQFASRGNVKMFKKLAPAFKGIGYAQCLASICVATYYCSLIAIAFFYLIHSFTSELPWSYCREEWEAENLARNITCVPSNGNESSGGSNRISSSELFFRREVLNERTDISDGLGAPQWKLLLCLLVAYFALFLITRNGIKSSGKAAYFLAIFPYVIMFCLLIRAATLEGADAGMLYFINPNWAKLTEIKVWYNAITQCFFSLNCGLGTIAMFASYNNFKQNIYRDSLIINLLDTFTSLLSGTTIFGILGHLAFKLNVDVSEVINAGGTGLAFISYPEAIAKFDAVPWLFAILFFFMLFVLGLGSMVAMQGASMTTLTDSNPRIKHWVASLGTMIAYFGVSIVYITNGGQFIFTLVDYYGGTMLIFTQAIFEVVLVMWWYGLENFCDDMKFMLNRHIGIYWRICWGIIDPLALIFVFLYFLITMEPLTHEGNIMPDIAIGFGWMIISIGLAFIPIWWIYYLYHVRDMGLIEGLKESVSSTRWGPSNPETRLEWKQVKSSLRERKSALKINWFKQKLYMIIGKKYY